MPEKDVRIIVNIAKAISGMTEDQKAKLLTWSEGVAFAVARQNDSEKESA